MNSRMPLRIVRIFILFQIVYAVLSLLPGQLATSFEVKADQEKSDPTLVSLLWSGGTPSGFSGELGLSRLFRVSPEKNLWIGPRIATLFNSFGGNELSFPVGVQGQVWLLNVVGISLQAEIIIPYFLGQLPISYRMTPAGTIRVCHLGENGALALQLALPYDTHRKWYVEAGIVIQWGGISSGSTEHVP